jgi:hypothetical protein
VKYHQITINQTNNFSLLLIIYIGFIISNSTIFHLIQYFLMKQNHNRSWKRPTGETTLKKTRQVHYLTGGVETCAYYEEHNFLNRYISEMVILRKKSIRIYIENCMLYNFCLIYFYDKTYRLAENAKNPFSRPLTLNNFFCRCGSDGDFLHFLYNNVPNVRTNFQLYANYSNLECVRCPGYKLFSHFDRWENSPYAILYCIVNGMDCRCFYSW